MEGNRTEFHGVCQAGYDPKDTRHHASVLTTISTRLEAKYYAHQLQRENKELTRRSSKSGDVSFGSTNYCTSLSSVTQIAC